MHIQELFELDAHLPILDELEDMVIEQGGHFELVAHKPLRFLIYSQPDLVEQLATRLVEMGCNRLHATNLVVKPAPKDGVVPDDFHSTSNYPTFVFLDGRWQAVERLRMDGCVMIKDGRPLCTLMRHVQAGDLIVCGESGVRISVLALPNNEEKEFAFMTSEVSSERQVPVLIRKIAKEMKDIRDAGGRIVIVAGPGIVHTGGMSAFCGLIEKGYVSALLSGNALATHDIENAFFGTSLGVNTRTAVGVPGGHRHHLVAINKIRYHGSIAKAVEAGALTTGIMYTIIRHNVPFVLAGSIRDDGPLPDTEMDLVIAQNAYAELVQGANMVIMISTMLHAIGTGNMIPATCKTICVDINPAVVSKLVDRGSTQATGVVTDAGLFVEGLNRELDLMEAT
ncbi:TIGR00300 family protein [Tumebacillus permanentifrigoris]|uniref:Lysine-ketoglutarate reductase/saccharopine dehydrogenase-like protein (TIGR00300 family) n=1 Tax=Tumebacillus permanentifrigoris TaxID=378543 RepID=A0A316D695_9BACL|nr:TIGR00300 family protein [Tumebacillus permanentifrigoris]PWK10250.1 lysine-ketoglutarate reductase/saccharopine dehydrogenase-like protein (TIGR00300 family) [Tumebacillus permanentifrigoris]